MVVVLRNIQIEVDTGFVPCVFDDLTEVLGACGNFGGADGIRSGLTFADGLPVIIDGIIDLIIGQLRQDGLRFCLCFFGGQRL